MQTSWIFMTYGGAALAALLLLFLVRARRWYWHVLGILVALVIGLVPIPPQLNTPQGTLYIGFVFTFLMIWGLGAPFFPKRSS